VSNHWIGETPEADYRQISHYEETCLDCDVIFFTFRACCPSLQSFMERMDIKVFENRFSGSKMYMIMV
jgi:hypothetical protein